MDSSASLKRLPFTTVKLLSSSQVITSVSSVVKELMENALDTGASSIEIFLYGHGLDKIVVRDNGCGIKESEVQVMCQRSYTSKITDFSDLEKLNSYGFRGEALFSICAVADVTVTTVHSEENYAKSYQMNHNGQVVESKPTNLDKGTIITVTNLFKNLPVRKQFLTSGKRKADEMKKVESVVKSLALINCEVKIRLSHDKFTLWQKASVCSVMRSFIQVLPPSIVKQMHEICYEDPNDDIKFTLLVPKQDSNIVTTCLGHSLDALFLFVNARPVREKQIEKVVHDKVFEFFTSKIPPRKYPAILVSIVLPPDMIDVNLEPNKTQVLIKDIEKVTKLLRDQLSIYYYGMDEESIMKEACTMEPPKRKIPDRSSGPLNKKPKKSTNEDSTGSHEVEKLPPTTKSESNCPNNESGQGPNNSEQAGFSSVFEPLSVSTPLEPQEPNSATAESLMDKHATISAFLDGLESKSLPSPGPASSPEASSVPQDHSVSKTIVAEDPFGVLMKSKSPEKRSEPVISSQFFSPERCTPGVTVGLECSPSRKEEKDGASTATKTDCSQESSNLEELRLSCWSRGDVYVNGKKLEGTTVIGGAQDSSDTSDPLRTSQSSADASDRSVSSQMGQKDMSAFTKFARQMRIEIVRAQPGISFPKIAKELTKRWQELQEEEKQTYKELALTEKLEKKNKLVPRASPPRRPSNEGLRSRFLKRYPTVEKISTSLGEIREAIKNRNAADFDEDTPEIVANISEDLSIVKEKSSVNVFSCSRLNEAIKFHNNLNNMFVEIRSLENGLEIESNDLGPLWSVLDGLPSNLDVNMEADHLLTVNVVSDERIVKNGLRIEKSESSTGSKYTIKGVAKNVSDFGLDALREILQVIAKDENCRLRGCRPLSVVELITQETIKSLSSQEFTRTEYTLSLYKHWRKKICEYNQLCPHGLPVSIVIYPVKR